MNADLSSVSLSGLQGHELTVRVDLPDGVPLAYALLAHEFDGVAQRLGNALKAQGIALFSVDFAASADQFASNSQAIVRIAEFMREQYRAPQLIIGHGVAGAAALTAVAEIAEVNALITINTSSDPAHEVLTQVAKLQKPLLIFHAPADDIVDIEHATKIFTVAKHPKSFVALDEADHELSPAGSVEFVAHVLSAWVGRYISTGQFERDARSAEGIVTVAESGESPFTQNVQVGRHHLKADEPLSFGGKNLGPSPYDLLLAGLGACTAMTIRMYADRKKLPLQHVSVNLTHDKMHAEDCEECETQEGKVDHIEREIHLHGDLDLQQRARLLEIADKCPVHRTLHSEIYITSHLAES